MCVDRGTSTTVTNSATVTNGTTVTNSTTVTNTVYIFYFPLSFLICHCIISSLSIFMWTHSKLNHVSDLPSTFLIHTSNMQLVYN
jgi:hypothetical protein